MMRLRIIRIALLCIPIIACDRSSQSAPTKRVIQTPASRTVRRNRAHEAKMRFLRRRDRRVFGFLLFLPGRLFVKEWKVGDERGQSAQHFLSGPAFKRSLRRRLLCWRRLRLLVQSRYAPLQRRHLGLGLRRPLLFPNCRPRLLARPPRPKRKLQSRWSKMPPLADGTSHESNL